MDMDNLLAGGGGRGGAIGQFPLEQWFYEMPVCTRWWTAATVATSLLVQCHIITPFQLFYSFRAVFVKNQVSPLPQSSIPIGPYYPKPQITRVTSPATVLASFHHIHLFWTSLPRPPLPRLLLATLLAPLGRIQRPLPRALLMATPLRRLHPALPLPAPLHPLPRLRSQQQPSIHLVAAQPRNPPELPGAPCLHSALPSLGLDGI